MTNLDSIKIHLSQNDEFRLLELRLNRDFNARNQVSLNFQCRLDLLVHVLPFLLSFPPLLNILAINSRLDIKLLLRRRERPRTLVVTATKRLMFIQQVLEKLIDVFVNLWEFWSVLLVAIHLLDDALVKVVKIDFENDVIVHLWQVLARDYVMRITGFFNFINSGAVLRPSWINRMNFAILHVVFQVLWAVIGELTDIS